MIRRRWQAISAFALATTFLGCGGGGGGGAELTKEQYTDEVEDICREQIDLIGGISGPEDMDDLKSMLEDTVTIYKVLGERLEGLNPPAEAESVHEALQNAVDGAVEKAGEAKSALDDDDVEKAMETMEGMANLTEDAVAEAEEFGIETCAQL